MKHIYPSMICLKTAILKMVMHTKTSQFMMLQGHDNFSNLAQSLNTAQASTI